MSTTITILKERLVKKQAQLVILEDTYNKVIAEPVKKYRFDSGDGSQQAERLSPEDIKKQINQLESEIDAICRRLSGKGLTNVTLRRCR